MGANSRTYKFALGEALIDAARRGRDEIPLRDLAATYSIAMVRHLDEAPQAPHDAHLGEQDFLTVAEQESAETLAAGEPTERLLAAAERSMPAMVMRKFHNLRGSGTVPHTFYELLGTGRRRTVRLSPHLLRLARSEQAATLSAELGARWNIVESSFASGVGRSLIEEGLAHDLATLRLTDKRRRRSVAGMVEATIGFQHGRCQICGEAMGAEEPIEVDHVFPFALMKRYDSVGAWRGPDLDALWNLAPAHASCNGTKSDRLPVPAELDRLAARNEAIMQSPHPLRQTLRGSLRRAGATSWRQFLSAVHPD
jgi:5-methylcytosine-specific restriction endonuclease McrA